MYLSFEISILQLVYTSMILPMLYKFVIFFTFIACSLIMNV